MKFCFKITLAKIFYSINFSSAPIFLVYAKTLENQFRSKEIIVLDPFE